MTGRSFFKTALTSAIVLLLAFSAQAQNATSEDRVIQVTAGKADKVDLKRPVTDILVANPAIADVGTLRSNRLYIVGRTIGDTNVLAYDAAGNQLANITVRVRTDDRNLQSALREYFPDERITARTVKDNIVLSGTVSTPAVSNQVREIASRFTADKTQTIIDLMKVRGQQQVMLKVKVVEAKRSVLRDLGIEPDIRAGRSSGLNFSANDVGRTATVPFGTGALMIGGKSASGIPPLSVKLRALETDGLVNTLAEPTLTAISGETAGFLAGGEYPVPTGKDSQGNIVLEFKQFGVSLNFTPSVLSKERIAMNLSTEVSEKDSNNGVKLSDLQVDGLSVRRAETTVEMASGGTLMIAGLLKSNTLHSMNGLPGLQSLPVLGPLFKSQSFTRGESELLIIVTPYLVDPYANSEAVAETPAPTSFEKRLGGMMPPTTAASPPVTTGALTVPRSTPLSQRLVANFKSIYGSRAPERAADGGTLSYIVE